MHIIIHVQQWLLHESPLCLGCSEVIPQTCDREYEKRLVESVGQATITQTFLVIIVVKTSRSLIIPITT